MTIKTLGIDLGKRCFHVFGADDHGKTDKGVKYHIDSL